MRVPVVFAMPERRRIRLELPPRLESWERSDHPDQVRLRAFVAHVRGLIEPIADDIAAPLALRLDVGLPESADPLWARDLDNYLFPIARGLPPQYVSIWGTKSRGQDSFVTVGPARPVVEPEWHSHRVPRALGSERNWKQAVSDAVAHAEAIVPGPVAMQVSFAVGAGRSWTSLWKRTIDGLDALLGRTHPDRQWNPQDGRIVRLGLHVQTDQTLGHDVEATIWARPADIGWPELRWLALMDADERAEYIAAHRATMQAAARQRAPSSPKLAVTPRSGRAGARRPGRPPVPVPVGLTELTTERAFDAAVAAGDLMLKTDSAGPPKIHTEPARCSGITTQNFTAKVIIGGGKNGRYFTLTDLTAVKQRWPRVAVCGMCKQLNPAQAATVEAAIHRDSDDPTEADR
jgi:hypothetical protein